MISSSLGGIHSPDPTGRNKYPHGVTSLRLHNGDSSRYVQRGDDACAGARRIEVKCFSRWRELKKEGEPKAASLSALPGATVDNPSTFPSPRMRNSGENKRGVFFPANRRISAFCSFASTSSLEGLWPRPNAPTSTTANKKMAKRQIVTMLRCLLENFTLHQ